MSRAHVKARTVMFLGHRLLIPVESPELTEFSLAHPDMVQRLIGQIWIGFPAHESHLPKESEINAAEVTLSFALPADGFPGGIAGFAVTRIETDSGEGLI